MSSIYSYLLSASYVSGSSLSKGYQEAAWQRKELVCRMEGAGSHWWKFRLYIKSSGTPWKEHWHEAGRKTECDFRTVSWAAAQWLPGAEGAGKSRDGCSHNS